MTQVSKYPVQKNVYEYIENIFLDTLSRLTNKETIRSFLDDFLSPTEKIMLSKRFAIFIMLGKGYDYREISDVLKVSPTTIAKASMSYKYLGKGCRDVVERIIKDEKIDKALNRVLEAVTGEFARSGKGSGMWRYLHHEVKKKDKKRAF